MTNKQKEILHMLMLKSKYAEHHPQYKQWRLARKEITEKQYFELERGNVNRKEY